MRISSYVLLLAASALPAGAQTPRGFGICIPASQRAGRSIGCFIVTEQSVGTLEPARAFWHVTRLPTRRRPSAAHNERESRSTILDAFGHSWLLNIADADVHHHSGPEAWHTMGGETLSRDAAGRPDRERAQSAGDRARRTPHGADGDGQDATPIVGAHPARRVAATNHDGLDLDSSRPMHAVRVAPTALTSPSLDSRHTSLRRLRWQGQPLARIMQWERVPGSRQELDCRYA
jgi:hypothetical protein